MTFQERLAEVQKAMKKHSIGFQIGSAGDAECRAVTTIFPVDMLLLNMGAPEPSSEDVPAE